MRGKRGNKSISLYKWIWQSYIHTVLIPLILIELIFIVIYFSSFAWSHKKNVILLKEQAQSEAEHIVNQEANSINNQLTSISNSVMLFRNQIKQALLTPATLIAADSNRLTYSKNGTLYTNEDSKDGSVSIFYSGIISTKEEQQQKVSKVLTTQKLMADIKDTEPLASSIYFNSFDSLNVTYPYSNNISQSYSLVNIPSHNFYYEADVGHNPNKKVIWTNSYLDPLSNGLITSAICPVYNDNFLEGVVGIDITLDTISDQILTMQIPWQGYGLLVDKNGRILSVSNKNELDLGLTENSYSNINLKDKLNTDEFNLYKNQNLASLANEVTNNSSGFSTFNIKGNSKFISWTTISNTDWKLLVIVSEENIYSKINALKYSLIKMGIFIIAGLLLSYFIFFILLYRKAQKASYTFANSLLQINNMVQKIGNREYNPSPPMLDILEFKDICTQLIKMGENLGETNKNLLLTQYQLMKKETDLKALVNSINDIIVEVDAKGNITNFWSKSHRDLFKLYEQGAFNSINDLLDIETSKIARKKIFYVMKTKENTSIDFNIESNSGLKWFQASISPRLNNSTRVVVSARDITVQKKMSKSLIAAKEEAEKASRAKSEFLSSMSHELRTPLNAILGFSQILELDPESPLTCCQQESVTEILKAGNHLLELINEVLDLSKIESGKLSISIESVSIKSVMEETLSIIKPFADTNKIKLISPSIENSDEFVYVDNTRLKQILLNLLSNAIKYNKPNGEVTFYHDKIDDKYKFHVIDTGIGLSNADLDLIFKPFQRLNKLNNSIEGTGIGLTVAKQLVELMNGNIYVESEKGFGSHFCVEFPAVNICATEAAEIVLLSEGHSSLSEEKHYTVLYIEDNPANLRLVERILNQITNIKMLSATSGELCVDLAIAHKPDLILLDINLPGIDGYEVFKRLKMYEETNSIPIVAISAHAMPKDVTKGISIGFTDYITKPINVAKFTEKVSNILLNTDSKNEN
ncbi:autoinducer 2 sensor kinase/phosphatase LuxQ [Clostridium puniceum]|uniref:Stage 0 sporulation protein A homolog n=1 Tax=Clostridium puniceum TaxID=29367 RepID=A0A1S8TM49_9CLOT|nr:ATP-binding protein [Clostridium puniceum]OOM78505.1 autoinducer 2 sensor kinase/phosphatase LuxQ [Clostridium puniceum]